MAELPDRYPLANATDDEIDSWLAADTPPYDEVRAALPWLDKSWVFDAWIEGVREAQASKLNPAMLAWPLPGAADLPLPPRRLAGRAGCAAA